MGTRKWWMIALAFYAFVTAILIGTNITIIGVNYLQALLLLAVALGIAFDK